MSTLIKPTQLLSITTALLASGGIATLTLFDVPELQSQPSSRSLPMTRWLFSRGSHIFPATAAISSAGFALLAFQSLSPAVRAHGLLTAAFGLLRLTSNGTVVNSYLAAAALTIGIGPFTGLVMIPTNFRLIELNEKKGGARSQKVKQEQLEGRVRSAEESVDGKGQSSQWTDLSGPQERTEEGMVSEAEEREVRELLGKFGMLNAVRAVIMGIGGVVGLFAALT